MNQPEQSGRPYAFYQIKTKNIIKNVSFKIFDKPNENFLSKCFKYCYMKLIPR